MPRFAKTVTGGLPPEDGVPVCLAEGLPPEDGVPVCLAFHTARPRCIGAFRSSCAHVALEAVFGARGLPTIGATDIDSQNSHGQ